MHISCLENALSGSGNGFAPVMMKFLGAENTFFSRKCGYCRYGKYA
jgi:hypothetical protein